MAKTEVESFVTVNVFMLWFNKIDKKCLKVSFLES